MIQTENFIETINNLALAHIDSLKNEPGFPGECVLSSHLLAAYLKPTFPEIELIYGTWGKKNRFHSWIKYKGEILDFTLIQFLTKKERKTFYTKTSKENMLEYLLLHQQSLLINSESPYFKEYSALTEVVPVFGNIYNADFTYEDFLDACKQEAIYVNLSWSKSRNKSGIIFSEFLEKNALMIKSVHRKWTIQKAG